MNLRALTFAIIASLALLAPLGASAQYNGSNGYNGNYQGQGQWRHRDRGARSGVISSVNGSSFTLQNGTTVFMRQGTVINPTGTTLQPGMRVRISGTRDGQGRINASQVSVMGQGTNGQYRHRHDYNNNYNGNYPNR